MDAAAAALRHGGVVGGGCLDVEADPVQLGKDRVQSRGKRAPGVQADADAEPSRLVDGGDQRGLHRRFTTGEDDAVELGAALVEEREDLAPRDRAGAVGVDEVGVVTVDAVPRAPLKEDRRGQVVGPVCSRESRESGDA